MTPLPLRIALGVAAIPMLVLAGFGAFYSVQINYQFGLTLAADARAAGLVAGALVCCELARIGMPFLGKALELAKLPHRWAGRAFWILTIVSVFSAVAYFKMNRDAGVQDRTTQINLTAGYHAELRDINARLKRPITRTLTEVDAELQLLGRGDGERRLQLVTEKAGIEQRAKDLKRLPELKQLDVWKTTVAGDVQADAIADALPWFQRDVVQFIAAYGIIMLVIACIELLVGRTPFMAVMALAWACKREKVAVETAAPAALVTAAPDDHVSRFIAACIARSSDGATQWKQLYGGYTKFCASKGWQPLNEFRLRPALQAALGGSVQTEKRHRGMFYLTLVLKPQWLPEVSHAA